MSDPLLATLWALIITQLVQVVWLSWLSKQIRELRFGPSVRRLAKRLRAAGISDDGDDKR